MGSPLFNAPRFQHSEMSYPLFLNGALLQRTPKISSVLRFLNPKTGKEVLDSTENLHRAPELGRLLRRDWETVFFARLTHQCPLGVSYEEVAVWGGDPDAKCLGGVSVVTCGQGLGNPPNPRRCPREASSTPSGPAACSPAITGDKDTCWHSQLPAERTPEAPPSRQPPLSTGGRAGRH